MGPEKVYLLAKNVVWVRVCFHHCFSQSGSHLGVCQDGCFSILLVAADRESFVFADRRPSRKYSSGSVNWTEKGLSWQCFESADGEILSSTFVKTESNLYVLCVEVSLMRGDDASFAIEKGKVRCHESDRETSPFFCKFIVWNFGEKFAFSIGATTVLGASSSSVRTKDDRVDCRNR